MAPFSLALLLALPLAVQAFLQGLPARRFSQNSFLLRRSTALPNFDGAKPSWSGWRELQDFAYRLDDALARTVLGPLRQHDLTTPSTEDARKLETEKLRKKGVVAEKRRVIELESKLCRLLHATGGRLTEKEDAGVRRIFGELEALSYAHPAPSPIRLEGIWKLLYASRKNSFPLPARLARALKVAPLPATAAATESARKNSPSSLGGEYSVCDTVSTRLPVLPFFELEVSVDGRISPVPGQEDVGAEARQVQVSFARPFFSLRARRGSTVTAAASAAAPALLRLPCGQRQTVRLVLAHESEQFRLVRAADGAMLVFALKNSGCGSGAGKSLECEEAVSDETGWAAASAATETEADKNEGGLGVERVGKAPRSWSWPL